MAIVNANCPRIAIENPVGIMSSVWKKPTQIIQPYEYGDPHRKTTCLWLKDLPPLKPTKIVEPTLRSYICKNGKKVTFDVLFCETTPGVPRAKTRSKTFPGIAAAMAEQWGNADGYYDFEQLSIFQGGLNGERINTSEYL